MNMEKKKILKNALKVVLIVLAIVLVILIIHTIKNYVIITKKIINKLHLWKEISMER